MCFDICTINIRVSIRVRGLHLVFVGTKTRMYPIKRRGCYNHLGSQLLDEVGWYIVLPAERRPGSDICQVGNWKLDGHPNPPNKCHVGGSKKSGPMELDGASQFSHGFRTMISKWWLKTTNLLYGSRWFKKGGYMLKWKTNIFGRYCTGQWFFPFTNTCGHENRHLRGWFPWWWENGGIAD